MRKPFFDHNLHIRRKFQLLDNKITTSSFSSLRLCHLFCFSSQQKRRTTEKKDIPQQTTVSGITRVLIHVKHSLTSTGSNQDHNRENKIRTRERRNKEAKKKKKKKNRKESQKSYRRLL